MILSHVALHLGLALFAQQQPQGPSLAECYGPKMTVPGLGLASNTGSMWPTLKGGEIYPVIPAAFDSLKVGDVIVYYWPKKRLNITHRIIAIRHSAHGRALVCKGDANPVRDPVLVTAGEFVGLADMPRSHAGLR